MSQDGVGDGLRGDRTEPVDGELSVCGAGTIIELLKRGRVHEVSSLVIARGSGLIAKP